MDVGEGVGLTGAGGYVDNSAGSSNCDNRRQNSNSYTSLIGCGLAEALKESVECSRKSSNTGKH
jgi:hypothetical protein